MDNQTGVTPDSPQDTVSEDTKTQPVQPIAESQPAQKPPKGFVPYQALEEERTKRKELEEQLSKFSAPSEETEEIYSDEGKLLRGEIKALNERIRANERREALKDAESEFPILKEKKDDFEAFLEDEENKRLSIKKAARLFLAEQNLLAPEPPERKGLEKPTGGAQPPPEPKLSPDEIQNLMRTNWKQYEKLLRSGKI